MNEQIEARVQIAGTFEMRDKDGNLIKSVPFTGSGPVESKPTISVLIGSLQSLLSEHGDIPIRVLNEEWDSTDEITDVYVDKGEAVITTGYTKAQLDAARERLRAEREAERAKVVEPSAEALEERLKKKRAEFAARGLEYGR